MNDDFLTTYLNDHLAGAQMGIQVARDCLKHNPTGPLGDFLVVLLAEIEEEYEQLKNVPARLSSTENPAKKAASRVASKVARLKLKDAFSGYTDLTRLEELEGLALGVHGRQKLWAALEAACGSDERFSDFDFPALQERARRQHDGLEHHRLEAARKAFAPIAKTFRPL